MPQLAQFLSREELIELRTQANDNKVDRAEFGHLLEKLGQKTGATPMILVWHLTLYIDFLTSFVAFLA